MKNERKITEAEKRRAERFQKKAEALKSQGYTSSEHTIGIVAADIFAIIFMLPFVGIIAVPYFMYHKIPRIGEFSTYLLYLSLFIFLMMAEMAIHEGIHGLTWGLLSPDGFSTIEFGFIKEYATPYCYCGTPLRRTQYIIGSIMPTLVLGFLQGLVAIMTGNFLLFILSLIMMFGGGGDFFVDWMLIRYKTGKEHLLIMDHPTELGFVAFEK